MMSDIIATGGVMQQKNGLVIEGYLPAD